jgi:MFS family permease
VLKKTFTGVEGLTDGSIDFAVACIAASTAIGNLTSGLWAALANGRRKVPFLVGLMLATSGCVGLMATIPLTAFGAWMLVALVVGGWIFWSGVVTIRTTVWRANYPDADRATIAGRITTVQVLVMALAGATLGWSLDRSIESFRPIFGTITVLGLAGAIVYRGVRLRGQSRLARAERHGLSSDRPGINPLSALRVLGDDRRYAAYMACMMFFGFGNLMIMPTLAIIVKDEFDLDYLNSLLLTSVIPLIVMPFAIPVWARLLSRLHVISFRTVHSWTFVLASGLFLAAVEMHALPLLFIASATLGLGFAGGMLAWNLGHQHFAPPHRDAQYMSVHVMLTGLRGLAAPFLGVAIYTWLAARGHPGLVYAVSLGLNILGAFGFLSLRAWERRRARSATA